jgi:hypothetical protein
MESKSDLCQVHYSLKTWKGLKLFNTTTYSHRHGLLQAELYQAPSISSAQGSTVHMHIMHPDDCMSGGREEKVLDWLETGGAAVKPNSCNMSDQQHGAQLWKRKSKTQNK